MTNSQTGNEAGQTTTNSRKNLIRRRTFVTGVGATAATTLGVGTTGAQSTDNADSFAVIADTHIDPHVQSHSDNLKSVFSSITNRQKLPNFVFHVGDVVESGLPGEYEEYKRLEPDSLSDRIHVVPGNHEFRWDQWARHKYHERFGETPYSFDSSGIHFIGLDPTSLLQEGGYFDSDHIEWLK